MLAVKASGVSERYRTVVADPPWAQSFKTVNFGALDHRGRSGTGPRRERSLPYSTMPLPEIAGLPVRDLVESDAHLYLWTTTGFLKESYDIATAWGFSVAATLVWEKPPSGFMGGAFLNNIEFVHFCRRGSLAARTQVRTRVFRWSRGEHSAKPEAFLDLVESVSPGPYLEMFARRNRLGWDTWGNEALEHVALDAFTSPEGSPSSAPDFLSGGVGE